MKPSDVLLTLSFPPLAGTMGRVEAEAFAVLMLRAMVRLGDTWQALEPKQLAHANQQDVDEKHDPVAALSHNPFWRPDVHEIVNRGFARFVVNDANAKPVEFTEKGLEHLKMHAPITVECDYCHAKPDEICTSARSRTAAGDATSTFHVDRVKKALALKFT